MSTSTLSWPQTAPLASSRRFAGAVLAVLAAAWMLAVQCPLGFSIVAVFLFAGPHNWCECRYFMTKMPPRWGPLRSFFLTGLLGVPLLAGMSALFHWRGEAWGWGYEEWMWSLAVWNSLFAGWLLALVHLRSQQNPRRSWPWIWPAVFTLVALNWLWPVAWSLTMVYLHPLVALWFLDREIAQKRPQWLREYRACVALVPVLCGLLIWRLAAVPDLPGEDILSRQITNHAGASILSGVSSHMLVSLHVFLEMLHYAVWVVAIPLVGLSAAPWKLSDAPLARRSPVWKLALAGVLVAGLLVVLGFWASFLADYPVTRDVYFTVALLHVLAEVPFLLRTL